MACCKSCNYSKWDMSIADFVRAACNFVKGVLVFPHSSFDFAPPIQVSGNHKEAYERKVAATAERWGLAEDGSSRFYLTYTEFVSIREVG